MGATSPSQSCTIASYTRTTEDTERLALPIGKTSLKVIDIAMKLTYFWEVMSVAPDSKPLKCDSIQFENTRLKPSLNSICHLCSKKFHDPRSMQITNLADRELVSVDIYEDDIHAIVDHGYIPKTMHGGSKLAHALGLLE